MRMFESKADFRAARERCGISQQMLASKANVKVLSVKRWEKPGEAEAPSDVQTWLGHMLDLHIQAVEAALDAVDEMTETQGTRPATWTCSITGRRNTTTVTAVTRAITPSPMPAAGR